MIKSKLYIHQKKNLQFHLQHSQSADWSEPGVGKSLIALVKIAILKDLNIIKKVLIVCPKTVIVTWNIEIEKHTDFTYTNLVGDIDNKIHKLGDKSDIFLITYDSIPGRNETRGELLREIALSRFDFLLLDEATMVKNREAIRTGSLVLLGDLINNKLFLSGTPITNDMTSIITIYRILDGGKSFGKNFFSTRRKYFKDIGTYYPNWVLKDQMKEEFIEKIYSMSTRLTKEECLDLPPKVWTTRYTKLSKEQINYYKPIAEDIVKQLDTEKGKVNIKSALDKIGKLSQISSGFVYTDTKDTFIFQDNPKLDLLREVICEFPEREKIIIYCRWRAELKIIEERCRECGFDYVSLSGETENRREVVDRFQNGSVKILICNIGVGKYSLTLTSSSTVIYYSMGFSVEEFIQSSDRIHRISQTKTCLYIPLLIHGGIDEYIYKSVTKKVEMAQAIVDPEFRKTLTLEI